MSAASTSSSLSSSSSSRPWLSWPVELPSVHSTAIDISLWQTLHDETFHRNLHQLNRSRLLSAARSSFPSQNINEAAIIIAGGTSRDFELYDSDTEKTEFRQEAYFRWVFGINEPDCVGIIQLGSEQTQPNSILFVPEVTDDSQRWNGTRRPLSYYTDRYGVGSTHLTQDLHSILQQRGIKHLYLLYGQNLDSDNFTRTPVEFAELSQYTTNNTLLHPLMTELRVIKTSFEIELMRLGNLISSQAHVYVMRHIRSGLTEMHLEAMYKSWCHYFGGCRHMAYTCICGSGVNGSILHYGHAGRPNDRILKDGDTVVLDMGAEYSGYATDITRSYAINGKFTPDQKIVHNAVHAASAAVLASLKPGVLWTSMHKLAERVILQHLLNAGLLQNGTLEDFESAYLGSVFMPHGLGHLLGLWVHDVGGYLPGQERSTEPGVSYLRLGRELKAGMVLTVEPGVYFNDPTLDKALKNEKQAKFINQEVLQRFRGTGGCRIEDDVLITENGAENLTILPTSVEEIEEVIQAALKK